jgi:hypothetical protein
LRSLYSVFRSPIEKDRGVPISDGRDDFIIFEGVIGIVEKGRRTNKATNLEDQTSRMIQMRTVPCPRGAT